MTKKISPFVIVSIISLMAGAFIAFITKSIRTFILAYTIASVVAFVSSIIALATMKKRNQKGKVLAILCLIIGLVLFGISLLFNKGLDLLMDPKVTADGDICKNAIKCVDKNGVSTCKFKNFEQVSLKCNTSLLKDNQMK